ncbi:IS110 family transposase [Streptomyces vinaceus]
MTGETSGVRVVSWIGDDGAESHHDVEVQDATGRRLATVRLPEGVEGLARLHELVAHHGGEDPQPADVTIGTETDRGAWVRALTAVGYRVYAANPRQAARFKERYATSGAKSDKGDAHALADMVRIGHAQLRPVAGDSDQAQAVKVVARAHQTLIWERTRAFQRMRAAPREYYPAALAAYADLTLTSTDALELLVKEPTPQAGAKLTRTQITAVPTRHRRHRRDAKANTVQSAPREKQLTLPEPVTAAFAAAVTAHARTLTALNEQIEAMEAQVKAHFLAHPDAEIYLSMPGIAEITGARVLAESGDDPTRYMSAKARKNYAGTSPITRASGKVRTVQARFVRNNRLADALQRQAGRSGDRLGVHAVLAVLARVVVLAVARPVALRERAVGGDVLGTCPPRRPGEGDGAGSRVCDHAVYMGVGGALTDPEPRGGLRVCGAPPRVHGVISARREAGGLRRRPPSRVTIGIVSHSTRARGRSGAAGWVTNRAPWRTSRDVTSLAQPSGSPVRYEPSPATRSAANSKKLILNAGAVTRSTRATQYKRANAVRYGTT